MGAHARTNQSTPARVFPREKDTLVTFLWYGLVAGGGHSGPSLAIYGPGLGHFSRPALWGNEKGGRNIPRTKKEPEAPKDPGHEARWCYSSGSIRRMFFTSSLGTPSSISKSAFAQTSLARMDYAKAAICSTSSSLGAYPSP